MQVVVAVLRMVLLAGELALAVPLAYLVVLSLAAPIAQWRDGHRATRRAGSAGSAGSAGASEAEGADGLPPRFAILVPAHNEAAVIGDALHSIAALEYPTNRYTPIVVADNCSDDTAVIARAAGAEVYERFDTAKQAKGYALGWLLDRLAGEGRVFDAYVVVDADSRLSANFLRAMAIALANGALVAQGQYRVLNGADGWIAGLRAVAIALFNHLRPLGRSLFGWSAGLKGNGMVFSQKVVERFGWAAAALTEDAEYHIQLVQAGIRVAYVADAIVSAEMPVSLGQARSQQDRWERGRVELARGAGWSLVREFVRTGDLARLDAALELALPPLSMVVGAVVCCCAFAAALQWWPGLALAAALALALGLHVLVGAVLAQLSAREYLSLLRAPVYIVWKCWVYLGALLRRGSAPWIRTQRASAK
jgi:cellulose synthase/poly-beta-1,6-N-acetylglucosamine synthase-like glycosyltransferase